MASSYGSLLSPGDEIILTQMEHHSNIVPWQLLEKRAGIVLKVVPVDEGHGLEKLAASVEDSYPGRTVHLVRGECVEIPLRRAADMLL